MKKIKSWLALFAMLLGKKSFAAAAGGSLSVLSAVGAGYDPLPWIVATAGAVVMLARSDSDPSKDVSRVRKDALANGLISIVGGGLGGPWLAALVGVVSKTPSLESPLLMTFAFAVGWQFFAYKAFPAVWPIAQSWLSRKAGGQ